MVSYGRFNRSNTSIKSSGRRTSYRRRRFGYTTKREQLVIPLMDYVRSWGSRQST